MPVEISEGDLARTTSHEPDQSWPAEVKVQLIWNVDGHTRIRSAFIDADYFFGRGQYGAPMDGVALVQMIERMRREGPPEVTAPKTFVPKEKLRGKKR